MFNERILFFDMLRILAILIVVLGHVCAALGSPGWYGIQNFDYTSFAGTGVTLFLIVSGAALTVSHPRIKIDEYKEFVFKRAIRIYPAYWIACAMAVLVAYLFAYQNFLGFSLIQYVLTFSGFYAFLGGQFGGSFGGPILAVGWYIGLIISLYLLYPLIARLFDRDPYIAIVALFAVSIISRLFCGYLQSHGYGYRMTDWFPLCRVFEFGLGIYLIRTGLYLKINLNGIARRLIVFGSELSFYVFLAHYPFIFLNIYLNYGLSAYEYYAIVLVIIVPVLSMGLYILDGRLKRLIDKRMINTVSLSRPSEIE
jgi:peptidoglycan/LPS O-acetylase OafA/YrhL